MNATTTWPVAAEPGLTVQDIACASCASPHIEAPVITMARRSM